jgi:hypothetical protein
MKNESGFDVMGMFIEPGIVPVAWSSAGSRVSIRIVSGEGLVRWACT